MEQILTGRSRFRQGGADSDRVERAGWSRFRQGGADSGRVEQIQTGGADSDRVEQIQMVEQIGWSKLGGADSDGRADRGWSKL